MREVTSKHIDGITDLVVIAPIREGFIDAYENVTFDTRARIVAEALHNLRVSAREYERDLPFSDIAERILTLLDYRIAIFDRDLFQVHWKRGLTARRYIVLAVTFDGPWEPYMRLVWRPLGVFLDLIFCNCEDYRPACDSSFEDYARWVRSVQVDSAIFYSTTGLTLRDQIYLRDLERVQRDSDPATVDGRIARLVMPDPELQAAADLAAGRQHALELGLEALTVLYRLSDYFPPDRLDPNSPAIGAGLDPVDPDAPKSYTNAEGRYLLRAARCLLQDFDFEAEARKIENFEPVWEKVKLAYREQLAWFNDTAHLVSLEGAPALGVETTRPVQAPASGSASQASGQGGQTAPKAEYVDALAKALEEAELPIGWEGEAKAEAERLWGRVLADRGTPAAKPAEPARRAGPAWPAGWLMLIAGYLLTALAATLGSPFWFDMLGRLVNVRSAMKPAEPPNPAGPAARR